MHRLDYTGRAAYFLFSKHTCLIALTVPTAGNSLTPAFLMTGTLSLFKYQLQYHLLREGLRDHIISNSHHPHYIIRSAYFISSWTITYLICLLVYVYLPCLKNANSIKMESLTFLFTDVTLGPKTGLACNSG